MPSNYPGSLDSYTDKTDGVDVVMAAHINNLQDAIEAIEIELGTDPSGESITVASAIQGKIGPSGGNLSGDLTADSGVKIDGVDISVHTHSGAAGDAPNLPISSVTSLQSTLDAKLPLAGGNLTGDVTADGGVKVDGVDVSAHTHSGAAGDAPNIPISSVASLQTSLDAKVAKAGDTMSGNLAMDGNKVTGLGAPSASGDAATKDYVDTGLANKVAKAGDTMAGNLDMNTNHVVNLGAPSGANDAATKGYVDGHVNLPTSGQRAALDGTAGTPGASNRYVTETDRSIATDSVIFRDDFIGARDARWTLSGTGGTYTQNAELGGTGTLATGATSGNAAVLTLNGSGCTDKTKSPFLATRAKLSSTSAVGSGLAVLINDPNNVIDIFYDAGAGANFKYRCKSGGTQTVVDSGVAADTAYHVFTIDVDAGASNVTFTIDGANSQTIATNVPTALLEPKIALNTTDNNDKQLTVDFVYLEADR